MYEAGFCYIYMEDKKSDLNISIIVSFIIVVAIVGLVVYALLHKSSETVSESGAPESTIAISDTKPMEKIAKNGDTLSMNYTGRLTDGTVFDSNVDPKFGHVQPFEFILGAGQVIKGWDEGLVGMKIGEKKTLTILPEKGYGARGQGSIPPNATLIFEVELVAIK